MSLIFPSRVSYDCAKQQGLLDKSFVQEADKRRFIMAGGNDQILAGASPEVLKGVGKKTAQRLAQNSVKTVADFITASADQFGKKGSKKLEAMQRKLTSCSPRTVPLG